MFENAIEKQAEWAAPSSSSGVVIDEDPSDRAFHVTGNSAACDESRLTVPDPDLRSPFQTVVASLVTAMETSKSLATDVFGDSCSAYWRATTRARPLGEFPGRGSGRLRKRSHCGGG
jgi:hypothetical protein